MYNVKYYPPSTAQTRQAFTATLFIKNLNVNYAKCRLHNIVSFRVKRRAVSAAGAIIMVDCRLGRRHYLGRIMRPCHGVNGGSWEKKGRDKRTENIPLKTAMVSSRGLGKTILHQKKKKKKKTLPQQPLSARCICYHGTQPRQPLSCLSRLGRERDSQYVSLACSWSWSRRVRVCECVCVRACVLHVSVPAHMAAVRGLRCCTLTETRHTTWII